MRISDWSSDVCSSDLPPLERGAGQAGAPALARPSAARGGGARGGLQLSVVRRRPAPAGRGRDRDPGVSAGPLPCDPPPAPEVLLPALRGDHQGRSEERRVRKECVRPCKSRWSPDHSKKNHTNNDTDEQTA